MTVEMVKTY